MKGKDVVVLGVEKKTTLQLQDPRTVRKVAMLDEHVFLAFAGELRISILVQVSLTFIHSGLTADGRVLIDKARVECQNHRLTVEDPVTIEYITRHIAQIKQVSSLMLSIHLIKTELLSTAVHSIRWCPSNGYSVLNCGIRSK